MNVTEAYVDGLALNAGAIKNGRDLMKKNSFPLLCVSEDGAVIFGECKGSGKEPYRCSVDFANPASPVFRCSCPSRQFPCKHILGLLYAYADGRTFQTAPIPPDLQEKRDKAEKREEKKKETAAGGSGSPAKRKTNKSALVKKAAAQLEGIEIAEKLIRHIAHSGLGSLDPKSLQLLEDQAKELGNYYIPGIQIAMKELLFPLRSDMGKEERYSLAMEKMLTLHVLLKRGREHLGKRAENPDTPLDLETTLEERIGHAWQMAELRENGLSLGETGLLQLAFRSYADEARGEYVDEGYWMELKSGSIYTTRTYRPFRAAKYIREDDSVYEVVLASDPVRYPGDMNARIRWEEAVARQPQDSDYELIRGRAKASIPEAVKQVKNQIKNPLSDKHPVLLLRYTAILQQNDQFAIVDEAGNRLALADIRHLAHPTTGLLPMLNEGWLKDQAMLLMFEHDMEQGRLAAQPLSIVTGQSLIRLMY
ncbi:SWIM zinc finger family protein [Paenibacillus soyae]|uniref:SWIM zinc finger domain-containing protein n=1 Tax=Paenibacillus soyae TaxID=2969249 RepID=A0A9X2MM23_9BACL|nr:SWIM zinc finger family protein [Paenibacillus soyae]MCR2802735.1 SWIM zinc finger domain-containing protein [Paenibacillus soyae]